MRDERVHGIDVAAARRRHQCCFALGQGRVGIRSGLQQHFNQRRVSIRAGQVKRRNPIAVCGLDVCASANQHLGRLQIIRAGCPVQRRRPVGLRSVHIDTLLE